MCGVSQSVGRSSQGGGTRGERGGMWGREAAEKHRERHSEGNDNVLEKKNSENRKRVRT